MSEDLIHRHEKALEIRRPWESLFQECYDYALPAREGFHGEGPGQRRDDKIFDETAVVGTQEFASRLQAGMVPNFARWADLVSGGEVPPDQRQSIDADLDEVTEYVFEVIQNSNFAQEVHESFMDLAVGTGILRVDEGDAVSPIVCRSIPLPRAALEQGPDGSVGAVFFERRKVKYSQMHLLYPEVSLTDQMKAKAVNKDAATDIIEVAARDYTAVNEPHHVLQAVALADKHTIWKESARGVGSNPLIVFRWSTGPGEVYGRGPLVQALSAVKTANEVVELVLRNAHMAISGMYQMEDDGVVNPDTISIRPGTIVPIGMGSRGLMPVPASGSFDVSQLVLGDMRLNIKRALYNDMLGDPDRTPATATEIAERMADLSRRMGAAFGRLQTELVQPFLQRVIYILKKQGRIDLPTVNGREVKVKPVSPLAQAQANEDIASVARWLQLVGGSFGPEALNLLTDSSQVSIYLAKKFGVPESLIRDEAQRMQLLAMMQEQMAQRGQVTQTPDSNANPGPQALA